MEESEKEVKVIKDRCSKCNSAQTYRKKKGSIRVCRKCGHEEEIKEGKK